MRNSCQKPNTGVAALVPEAGGSRCQLKFRERNRGLRDMSINALSLKNRNNSRWYNGPLRPSFFKRPPRERRINRTGRTSSTPSAARSGCCLSTPHLMDVMTKKIDDCPHARYPSPTAPVPCRPTTGTDMGYRKGCRASWTRARLHRIVARETLLRLDRRRSARLKARVDRGGREVGRDNHHRGRNRQNDRCSQIDRLVLTLP